MNLNSFLLSYAGKMESFNSPRSNLLYLLSEHSPLPIAVCVNTSPHGRNALVLRGWPWEWAKEKGRDLFWYWCGVLSNLGYFPSSLWAGSRCPLINERTPRPSFRGRDKHRPYQKVSLLQAQFSQSLVAGSCFDWLACSHVPHKDLCLCSLWQLFFPCLHLPCPALSLKLLRLGYVVSSPSPPLLVRFLLGVGWGGWCSGPPAISYQLTHHFTCLKYQIFFLWS